MKRSTAAALLSGLVLPGLGQFIVLRRRLRGLAFMVPALAALSWVVRATLLGAAGVLEQAAAGQAPADVMAMAEQLSASAGAGVNLASLVLIVCWAGSVIDALLARA